MGTKWRCLAFVHSAIFGKNKTQCITTHTSYISNVKHGGGGVIIWVCFAATVPVKLAVINIMMNSILYQNVLEINVRLSVQQLKLGHNCLIEQGSDLKHNRKSTSE